MCTAKVWDMVGYCRYSGISGHRGRVADEQARQHKAAMVRNLIQKLEGSFSYSGTVHIDSDTKQELLAMMNSL